MSHPFLSILSITVASINSVHNWHKHLGTRYKPTLPYWEASPAQSKPVKRHTVSEKNVCLPGRFADLPHGKSTVLFRLGHFIRRNDATPPCLGGGGGIMMRSAFRLPETFQERKQPGEVEPSNGFVEERRRGSRW
jgi:hypothetical protein